MPENLSKKKILLAEDDASMRRFVEVMLQRAGFEVVSAEDGLAAMQIAFETDIDAMVADAMMPNMTGYDLCRMVRRNPDKKTVPLIILSGFDENGADAASECLADAYLVKGTNLKEQLTETLSRLLARNVGS